MKKLYVVLIKAHTGLGAVARKMTGYPYTHIAVSKDDSFTDFISFSRRYHFFPFDAGFTHEYRHYYAFGKHGSFGTKIFELELTDEKYEAVMTFISECENDSLRIFNIFSMATMPLIGGFRIWHADNCMSFTAKCIELSGTVKMEKPYWRYSIKDMDRMLSEHVIFEGELKPESRPDDDYMKPFSLPGYLAGMITVFSKLIFRMIFRTGKTHHHLKV